MRRNLIFLMAVLALTSCAPRLEEDGSYTVYFHKTGSDKIARPERFISASISEDAFEKRVVRVFAPIDGSRGFYLIFAKNEIPDLKQSGIVLNGPTTHKIDLRSSVKNCPEKFKFVGLEQNDRIYYLLVGSGSVRIVSKWREVNFTEGKMDIP